MNIFSNPDTPPALPSLPRRRTFGNTSPWNHPADAQRLRRAKYCPERRFCRRTKQEAIRSQERCAPGDRAESSRQNDRQHVFGGESPSSRTAIPERTAAFASCISRTSCCVSRTTPAASSRTPLSAQTGANAPSGCMRPLSSAQAVKSRSRAANAGRPVVIAAGDGLYSKRLPLLVTDDTAPGMHPVPQEMEPPSNAGPAAADAQ